MNERITDIWFINK